MVDARRCPVHCLSPIHLLMEHFQREQCNRINKRKPLNAIHVTSLSMWICIDYRGKRCDKLGSCMEDMNTIKEPHMVAYMNQELHFHWQHVWRSFWVCYRCSMSSGSASREKGIHLSLNKTKPTPSHQWSLPAGTSIWTISTLFGTWKTRSDLKYEKCFMTLNGVRKRSLWRSNSSVVWSYCTSGVVCLEVCFRYD